MSTDHEAKARAIVEPLIDYIAMEPMVLEIDDLASAITTALREVEAPLLKKIVELSGQIQRVEEINENLRSAVRDQPIKWNDEYYEMKLKEARLTEREACKAIADRQVEVYGTKYGQALDAGMEERTERFYNYRDAAEFIANAIDDRNVDAAAIRNSTDERHD